ncbi:MAG: class I SAM-dependent methyltransferase [Planctomycetaceae bacterium]
MPTTVIANVQGVEFELRTHPDLFSPKRIDAGTRAMLDCVELGADDRLLDLGCGYGVVGIYAAHVLGETNVCMLDADATAVEISQANATACGFPNLCIEQSDGFRSFHETGFTKILSNPPYHADFSVPKHFILKGFNRLEIGGQMWFVTKREKWYRNKLRSVFGNAKSQTRDGYFVMHATKTQATYAKRR